MPLTLRSSTRITSNRAARSVLVFSTQSLRRSASRALTRAIAALVWRAGSTRVGPVASLRCNRTSRSACLGRGRAGLDSLTRGERDRHGHAPVEADDLTGARRGDRVGDGGERDVPPPGPVPGDPVRPGLRQGPGSFEPDPAHLRHEDPGPAAADLLDPPGLRPDDPEPLVDPGLAPGRPVVGAGEEVAPRLVQVPQRLLLHGLRPGREPRLGGAGLGQLRGLRDEPGRRSLPAAPHQPLLEAQVPHVPGVRARLQQERLLRRGGVHPVPGHVFEYSVGP